jgi:Leucine-rich repeat (LRR) protein
MISLIAEDIQELSQIKGNPANMKHLILHANKISTLQNLNRFNNLILLDLSSNNITSTKGALK